MAGEQVGDTVGNAAGGAGGTAGGAAATDAPPAFVFVGGRPCLDFVATLGRRGSLELERLPDPESLARWFSESGLTPPHAPAATGTAPRTATRVTDADLERARGLRESAYRLIRAVPEDRTPEPADVALVNTFAAAPDLVPRLTWTPPGGPAAATGWTGGDAVGAALSTVARDTVTLLGSPLLARVKQCENPVCTLLFLDDSQARRRRWCSMERCGNLAKVAGYRSRSARRA
ncbi:ABATE domain-containing protein [Streptomyces sp. SID3212]|uniref:CGNR zinc finger domain-containing protein n=1 Tax=Streptomyces sp. SID3212 TaxID=2690259 RepID=UPI001368706F|nr:ABATE domain-containing protein [Streptomyces sp. SID3212]MYV54363.1 4-hydroxybenzoyl-CoA reductase [Streptomyces sp. SID3212]